MPAITYSEKRVSQPSFLAEFLRTDWHTIQTGAKLDPSAFTADADGKVFVPAGTLLGRTDAEQPFGPWATGDTEVYLSCYDVADAEENADVELLKPNFTIYHRRLPSSPRMWG